MTGFSRFNRAGTEFKLSCIDAALSFDNFCKRVPFGGNKV